jgi:hypothetical protein
MHCISRAGRAREGDNVITKQERELLEAWAHIAAQSERIAALEAALAHYRWRPISEIHEDFGSCVLMRIDDPGYMDIGSNLDEDFNEPGWTHFAEVPKLTTEEAEVLKAALAVPAKEPA